MNTVKSDISYSDLVEIERAARAMQARVFADLCVSAYRAIAARLRRTPAANHA